MDVFNFGLDETIEKRQHPAEKLHDLSKEVNMGTKNKPGEFDCYANALPDEPMFILLARDASAPELVEGWAAGRIYAIATGKKPQSDMAMVEEAQECAKAMRVWRADPKNEWRKDRTR